MPNRTPRVEKNIMRERTGTMMISLARTLGACALLLGLGTAAFAAEAGAKPERQDWSFAGIFGKYDKAQLQRGFQVYKEVCANCHTLNMPIRMLAEPGGPGFTEDQVKALAAEYKIPDINDAGEPVERAAKPYDSFPAPYANVQAAIATFGAYPPNMQVIAKARGYSRGFPLWVVDMLPGFGYAEHGADYIDALVGRGYVEAPAGKQIPDGAYYNTYMPGNIIKMAPPLAADGQITYAKDADGNLPPGVTETIPQYAKDVTAFLYWAAEPHLEQRKRVGFQVILFLIVLTTLLFLTKKRVWARAHAAEAH
jgi:ubiquinol-cytochrome c reductase cytochrome c1 subunit